MKRWIATACFSLAMWLPAAAQEIPAGVKLPVDTRFQGSPGAAEYPKAQAVLLKDNIFFRARPDGSSEFEEHDIIKVLNDRGVQDHRELFRVYRSDVEQIEVKRACTILPDGRLLEIPKQAIVDEPLVPDSKVYKSLRKFEIRYPGVKPNAIVEFHLVTRRKPLPGNKWWAVTYVQNPEPMVESTFEVTVPKDSPLRWSAPGVTSTPEKTSDGSWDRYFWKVTQLPPFEGEPLAPSSLTTMQRIEVSNFESWLELRNWFEKGWKVATEPDDKLRQQVASLYPADASAETRIRAITTWLAGKRIFQFPSEDLQPRPSSLVWQEAALTPLDAAALAVSCFQVAGVSVQPILACELPSERMMGQLPRANRVSQVILKVTAGDRVWWVDSEHVAELQDSPPSGHLGMGALLGDSENNAFQDLPTTPPDANRQESRIEARVDREGRAEVLLSLTEHGKAGLIYREASRELMASDKGKRDQILERLFERIARNFSPRARVHDRFFALGTKAGEPFDLSTTLSVPGYAVFEGDKGKVPLPIQPNDQVAGLAAGPAVRTQPVLLSQPIREEVRLHLLLPPGTKIIDLPPTTQVNFSYGSFFATARSEGNELWYYSRLTLDKTWIPADKTGELLDFARRVMASQASPITFTPPSRPAASSDLRH